MASSTAEWIEELKGISVLELSERLKALEAEFGVSATAVAAAAAAASAASRICSLMTHAAWSRSNRSSMASGELANAALAAGSHSTTESPDGDHQVRDHGRPSTATWITPLKGQL